MSVSCVRWLKQDRIITAELNDEGDLIGIEILSASTFIRDSIIETVKPKCLILRRARLPNIASWCC
jgi:hypothetical protein